MGRWQLFHALFRLRDWFFSIGQGAAQQNISKEKVATAPVVVPPKEISQLFDRLVSPFWEMRGNLERQQQKLAAARDLLLPRLISGQLSVEAAAPMLAAVAVWDRRLRGGQRRETCLGAAGGIGLVVAEFAG